MRIISFLILLCTIIIYGCADKTQTLTVKNSNNHPITDKAVTLSFNESLKYLNNPNGDEIIAIDSDGVFLATQNDDINGDGNIDEITFLINLKADETKQIHFKIATPDELALFPQRTNIRFGNKKAPFNEITSAKRLHSTESKLIQPIFQMEGPAWENDIVGFRNYYDARNGIDIFGKRTSIMALDSVGIKGQKYHSLDWWGMDILKVGNSLGAGAIAIAINDSIYRVGPCKEGSYRFICEGPVRAIFELNYESVQILDRVYNIKHQISIYAGEYGYESKVWVEGLKGDEELVTGIVDLHNLPLIADETQTNHIFMTHGNQGYEDEILGMALTVDKNVFIKNKPAPKKGNGITHTFCTHLKLEQPTEFSFHVGWEVQDPKFKKPEYFMEQLKYKLD
ncbi:DUF4861 family protein [Saccharicrinis aurantiacus]|uniref:DUF4861 family protein n=1 Tax=Saccharicrinis aurantiacus TaxID=1849719 RepID=UPI00248FE671|nr:DUF4861 family protein [Saccharicrinis aurantiacus]